MKLNMLNLKAGMSFTFVHVTDHTLMDGRNWS